MRTIRFKVSLVTVDLYAFLLQLQQRGKSY